MGLFNKKPVICDVCGEDCSKRSFFKEQKLQDGVVCARCYIDAGYNIMESSKHLTLAEVRARALPALERHRAIEEMPVSLTLDTVKIDTKGRRWYAVSGLLTEKKLVCPETTGVFSLDDVRVTSVENYVVENVNTQTKSHGMGRALVGAALAGPAGAVIGAAGARHTTTGTNVQQVQFRVHLRFLQPQELTGKDYWISFTSNSDVEEFLRWFKRDGAETADESSPAAPAAQDPVSELRRFKALLDEGLITQEDFDAKKKQLLGL